MSRFFSTEVVQHLVRGSYERTITKLEEALERAQLFGESSDVHILGTFSGYALVASDDGECARVKFEDLGDRIEIKKSEGVELPSYAADEVNLFLEEESSRVLSLWKKGNLTEAANRLKALTSLSGSWKVHDQNTFDRWEEALKIERPWEALLREKFDEIEEAIAPLNNDPQPSYHKLYDGTLRSEDLEKYRVLVTDSLDKLRERISSIQGGVSNSNDAVRGLLKELEEKDLLASLVAFSEDLLADLSRIDTIVEGSTRFSNRVDRLGRLHDLVIDKLSKADLAHNFVDTMATSLRKELNDA